jgi:hypothetical protein
MSNVVPGAGPGRRTAQGRRFAVNLTTVLAVLLPLLTVAALALVRPEEPAASAHDPVQTALTSSLLVCPTAEPGARTVYATTAEQDASGKVTIGPGGSREPLPVLAGRVATYDSGAGAVLVQGTGDLAPGLVAARFTAKPVASNLCTPPAPDQWFTGVGAGAGHRSVLELTNPDRGPAIVDVTLYGRAGIIDVPALRGVSVAGLDTVRVDLATTIPRRDELAIRVTSARGRVAASVLDSFDELGAGASASDQLLAQPAPSTSNVLMGVTGGAGRQTLVLANSGADEVRANVRIVTEDSVFAPRGVEEIRVSPESVKRVSLSRVLQGTDGVLGVVVDSTGPVTATLRSFVGGDLSHAVAGEGVSSSTTVVLPTGSKQLLLSGADQIGVVSVVAHTAGGKELASRRIELNPGRGVAVDLPDGATLLRITPDGTSLIGAVLVQGRGSTVVPLRELVRTGLIPDVRPGTP